MPNKSKTESGFSIPSVWEYPAKPMQEPSKENKCCKKCYSNYTEHTWPSHTVYDACINSSCPCHNPMQEPTKECKTCIVSCNINDDHKCPKECQIIKLTSKENWEDEFCNEFEDNLLSESKDNENGLLICEIDLFRKH